MGKNNKPHTIEYVKEQFEKKEYTLLSTEYKNKNTKLDFLCNKHKYIGVQKVSFASFSNNKCNCSECISELRTKNWYKCRNFKPITQEEFYNKHFEKYKEKLFNEVGNEYELLNVRNEKGKLVLDLLHNKCNSLYSVEQSKFFKRKDRCQNKNCIHERKSIEKMKPISKVKQEIYDLVGDEYELIGEYTGTNNNAIFYHKICGNTFQKTPHNFFAGQRCPHCIIPTKGEQRIIDYLEIHNEKYTFQKSYEDLRGINDGLLSYDIYIDSRNMLIEYQGQFHDGTAFNNDEYKFYRQQEHDRRKRQYAKDHNIKLLEIWYWDFDNIEEILSRELGLTA